MIKESSPASCFGHELRTLFIDMDGTLTDLAFDRLFFTETLPQRYANAAGASLAEARRHVYAELAAIQGTLAWYSLPNLSNLFGLDLVALTEASARAVVLQPGAIEFLDQAGKHYRRVLVTNADPEVLAIKLRHTGLAAWFDGVISAHHLGAAKEEAVFYERLAAIEPDCSQAGLLIDDNLHVVAAARRAGLQAVAIARPDLSQPTRDIAEGFAVENIAALQKFLPA